MKIYEYIQIDIDTGEVIEEVSYDYTGPVAQCGKGGGDISYESSPEQAQLFKLLQPLIEGVSEYGMHNMYRPMVEKAWTLVRFLQISALPAHPRYRPCRVF